MKRRLLPLIVVVVASLMSTEGIASTEERFCLAHPISDQILHFGCTARLIPNRVSVRVRCLNEVRSERVSISDHSSFVRVPAGEGACNPWEPPADVPAEDIPREVDAEEIRD